MSGYDAFLRELEDLKADVCRETYCRHRDRIKVKNEEVAVGRLAAIFEHALEISNDMGFQAMSVRDLSERTGISMGALYSYIESKEMLLDMILCQVRVAVERALALPEAAQNPRQRLRWLLRRHLYLSEAMQGWFYFSYMESRHFEKEARERAIAGELRTEKLFIDCLKAGIEQGVFRPRDPELTAALIKPLLQEWYLKRWKYRRRGLKVDAYADAVTEFIEAAVLMPKACQQ